MRAIVHTGPEEVEVQERERPDPGPGEVVIDVAAAGLCGSDAHAYLFEGGYEWIKMPRVMGHEYAGTVAAVGEGVDDVAVGDRVIEEPVHSCGECFQCRNGQSNVCQDFSIKGMHRDGAYSEYTVADASVLHDVPEGVSLAHAAVTEPLSVAVRAVRERSRVVAGEQVLVEGPGPIGVLVAAVADATGADVVVSGLEKDVPHRFPVAESMGAETVTVDELDDVVAGLPADGFDVVFDTTGHHTGVEMAVEHVRKGGQVVAVGLPGEASELPLTDVVRAEVDVCTSYASNWRDFDGALRLLESGAVDPAAFVDPTPVEEAGAAFESFLGAETVKPLFEFDDV